MVASVLKETSHDAKLKSFMKRYNFVEVVFIKGP
jgi:hypothetical protein